MTIQKKAISEAPRPRGMRSLRAAAVGAAALALVLALGAGRAEACSACESKDKCNTEASSGFESCRFVTVEKRKRTRVGIWRWLLGGEHLVEKEVVCQPVGDPCRSVVNPGGGDVDPEIDPDGGTEPDQPVGGGLG